MAATLALVLVLHVVEILAQSSTVTPGLHQYSPTWDSVTKHATPAWFPRAKFGLWAHFGVYCVPAFGSEWYSRNMYVPGSDVYNHHQQTYGPSFGYKDFIPKFTAANFNATQWASLYAKAGAKYGGPVAEHADGFAMFNTSYSDFNAAKMGPKRDIVAEMTAAVKAHGMKVVTTLHHQWLWAWYPTWNATTDCSNSSYQLNKAHGGLYGPLVSGPEQFSSPNTTQEFQDYFLAKALEVARNYKPDLMYFDSKWAATIDDLHRLTYLADFYNQALENNQDVAVTYKQDDLHDGAGIKDFERGGVSDILRPAWQTGNAHYINGLLLSTLSR